MPSDIRQNKMLNLVLWALLAAFLAGILLSVLVPTVADEPSFFDNFRPSRKIAAGSDLGQIAEAYGRYLQKNRLPVLPPPSQLPKTAHAAAFLLAQNNDPNNAAVWFIKSDEIYANAAIPEKIISGDVATARQPDTGFAVLPLSVFVAANISIKAPAATTPIAWTRGLQPDGTWSQTNSPWKGKGGHIAFLDGHVDWADRLSTEPGEYSLVKFGTQEPTVNILEALPPGAVVLPAEPEMPAVDK